MSCDTVRYKLQHQFTTWTGSSGCRDGGQRCLYTVGQLPMAQFFHHINFSNSELYLGQRKLSLNDMHFTVFSSSTIYAGFAIFLNVKEFLNFMDSSE